MASFKNKSVRKAPQLEINVPWWTITQLVIETVKAIADDIGEAKADGKIDREEWTEIVAENLLEIIPKVAEILHQRNS